MESRARFLTKARSVPSMRSALLWSALGLTACGDTAQPVSVTLEDFRFVPDVVRVTAERPLAVSLYNAGREPHEFDSLLLQYASPAPVSPTGILLQPGRSASFSAAPPAGTYLYICRRKGHANMTGTLIVE